MAHFLYAVPRLVFLCAPLVYLLLGRTIIPGYWVAIMVYALPHLILSSLTNSRAQSWHRHSFWNEIYETVLAPYILMPTLLALINPKLGKFNVTDKGSTLAESRFDRKIAYPTEWLLLLNFAGMVSALYQLCIVGTPHPGAVVMNLFWVFFNMVILGVAAAVAYEQQQRRGSVRIDAVIPVRATLADGSQFQGMTIDMSVGGASIRLTGDTHIALGDSFKLAFPDQTGDAEINVKAAGIKGDQVRLEFSIPTIPEQEIVTRALYSRADAWISPIETKEVDRPLVSLGRVIKLSIYGIYQIIRSWFPRKSVVDNTPSASAAAQQACRCAFQQGIHGNCCAAKCIQCSAPDPQLQGHGPAASHRDARPPLLLHHPLHFVVYDDAPERGTQADFECGPSARSTGILSEGHPQRHYDCHSSAGTRFGCEKRLQYNHRSRSRYFPGPQQHANL
jgi:cellulose synthase (UDP-forming)